MIYIYSFYSCGIVFKYFIISLEDRDIELSNLRNVLYLFHHLSGDKSYRVERCDSFIINCVSSTDDFYFIIYWLTELTTFNIIIYCLTILSAVVCSAAWKYLIYEAIQWLNESWKNKTTVLLYLGIFEQGTELHKALQWSSPVKHRDEMHNNSMICESIFLIKI